MMTFLNWLCYTEWQTDVKIAEKHGVEMYFLDMNSLRRRGNVKAQIDGYKNYEYENKNK